MNFSIFLLMMAGITSRTSASTLISQFSNNVALVKEMFNFKLDGTTYRTQKIYIPVMAKTTGGSYPTSYSHRSELKHMKSMASNNFKDAWKSLMQHFDIHLYQKLVELLPKVNTAIEDTIFEMDPTQEVNWKVSKEIKI